MEINKPPEKLQTKDLEESLNLKESVKTKINQSSVHKSSVNKDIIKEVNKNSINSKTISKPRKSLSLERNTESDTKFKQEQKLNENKEKSVRFNEIAKHNRQPSEIDTYIENKKKMIALFGENEIEEKLTNLKDANPPLLIKPNALKELVYEEIIRTYSPNSKYSNADNVGSQTVNSPKKEDSNKLLKSKMWRFLFISIENIFKNHRSNDAIFGFNKIKDISNMSNKIAIKQLAMKSIIKSINQREALTKANKNTYVAVLKVFQP